MNNKRLFLNHIRTFFFLALLITVGNKINGQCLGFAKKVGKAKLGNFIHDGNYNATVLGAGETAELYKTFFKDQKYRIAVSKIDNLPVVNFKLVDENNNTLFDNKNHNFIDVWDFSVETTQTLVIKLKVLDDYDSKKTNTEKGCVAVLFGIEKD